MSMVRVVVNVKKRRDDVTSEEVRLVLMQQKPRDHTFGGTAVAARSLTIRDGGCVEAMMLMGLAFQMVESLRKICTGQ